MFLELKPKKVRNLQKILLKNKKLKGYQKMIAFFYRVTLTNLFK